MINRISTLLLILLITPALFAGGQSESVPVDQSAGDSKTISITDYSGRNVEINLPVKKIVTMNSGLSEILAALGASDLVVGRCSYSTFPSQLRSIKVVGKNSSSPNMESILELEPDLVIADSMFDTNKMAILNNRGIAVIIESTSNPDRLPQILKNLGEILEKEDKAAELQQIIEDSILLIREKISEIQKGGSPKPIVFFENRKPYKSASRETGHHQFIALAGGINIAADEPVKSPQLSPEFIALNNPDIIIRRVSGDVNKEALSKMIDSIYDRPSLNSVKAIQNNRVYTVKSDLFISLRYPVGVAYFASLFYPDQFPIEEADEIHKNFIIKLYGEAEWDRIKETYVYSR